MTSDLPRPKRSEERAKSSDTYYLLIIVWHFWFTVYVKSPATNDFDIVRFCKRSVYERRLCEQIVSEQRESHSLLTALARLEKLGKS